MPSKAIMITYYINWYSLVYLILDFDNYLKSFEIFGYYGSMTAIVQR